MSVRSISVKHAIGPSRRIINLCPSIAKRIRISAWRLLLCINAMMSTQHSRRMVWDLHFSTAPMKVATSLPPYALSFNYHHITITSFSVWWSWVRRRCDRVLSLTSSVFTFTCDVHYSRLSSTSSFKCRVLMSNSLAYTYASKVAGRQWRSRGWHDDTRRWSLSEGVTRCWCTSGFDYRWSKRLINLCPLTSFRHSDFQINEEFTRSEPAPKRARMVDEGLTSSAVEVSSIHISIRRRSHKSATVRSIVFGILRCADSASLTTVEYWKETINLQGNNTRQEHHLLQVPTEADRAGPSHAGMPKEVSKEIVLTRRSPRVFSTTLVICQDHLCVLHPRNTERSDDFFWYVMKISIKSVVGLWLQKLPLFRQDHNGWSSTTLLSLSLNGWKVNVCCTKWKTDSWWCRNLSTRFCALSGWILQVLMWYSDVFCARKEALRSLESSCKPGTDMQSV